MARLLVAFDFDNTLVNENSDLYISKLAPEGKIPKHIKEKFKPDGWTEYMDAIFEYLHENKITQKDFFDCLREIPLVNGMMELLDELRKDNYEVIIISDANSEFIRCILQAAGVFDIVHTTYTNPAHWDASGRLHVQYYHTQDWCDLSTRNLCKGQILDTHIKVAQEQRSVKFSHVVYVGDGRNDLCPSLRLKSGDVICPRKGFSLVKDLAKLQEGELKCKVVPWDTGFVLLRHIKELSCS